MNSLEVSAFTALLKEAYQKCFGHPMEKALSETESKLFSNKIFDETGLVIGAKSIKNYSFYILNNGDDGKKENPSVATLDTLARYVLNAPYTDEIKRKNNESHYPYWFQYKDSVYKSIKKPRKHRLKPVILILLTGLVVALIVIVWPAGKQQSLSVEETFQSLSEDSLVSRGWFVHSKDINYWNRRDEKPGHLTLFTLKGDNWPDSATIPGIRNLLLRKISADCFTAEVQLADFIPLQNWQQAGILLLEDTSFTGKSIRISLAYNNFFGGYTQKPEIIIQAITSSGKGSKPEEISHKLLFNLETQPDSLVMNNLKKSALRIEKHGEKFRLLYATAPIENFAFREAVNRDFSMTPRYIGIFALKGQMDSSAIIPAYFKSFRFIPEECIK